LGKPKEDDQLLKWERELANYKHWLLEDFGREESFLVIGDLCSSMIF
jgi:hypothetical protein